MWARGVLTEDPNIAKAEEADKRKKQREQEADDTARRVRQRWLEKYTGAAQRAPGILRDLQLHDNDPTAAKLRVDQLRDIIIYKTALPVAPEVNKGNKPALLQKVLQVIMGPTADAVAMEAQASALEGAAMPTASATAAEAPLMLPAGLGN